MSVFDKLKDLVSSIEDDEELQKEIESGSKELSDLISDLDPADARAAEEELAAALESVPEPAQQSEQENSPAPASLECTREETAAILAILQDGRNLKSQLANLVLQYEDRKRAALGAIGENSRNLYAQLNELRIKNNIPEEGYSIEIPALGEDKNIVFTKE